MQLDDRHRNRSPRVTRYDGLEEEQIGILLGENVGSNFQLLGKGCCNNRCLKSELSVTCSATEINCE